jgi:hypothetical protein
LHDLPQQRLVPKLAIEEIIRIEFALHVLPEPQLIHEALTDFRIKTYTIIAIF